MKAPWQHRADLLPAAIITCATALALAPFLVTFSTGMIALLAVVSTAGRSIAPVHQHCHSHRKLFRSAALNHLYDFVLMLGAGNTTAVWEMQHVVGHHQAYLDPRRDPAAVDRFGTGPLQQLVFTVFGDACSFTDSLAIARRGKPRRVRRLLVQQLIQVVTLAGLLFWNAKLALALFIVPDLLLRWMIFYISYEQHHGVPNIDVYSGSVTRLGWTNSLFLNVGHHTAHHEKPTMHWTLLPERTEQIRERIPAACLRGAA